MNLLLPGMLALGAAANRCEIWMAVPGDLVAVGK